MIYKNMSAFVPQDFEDDTYIGLLTKEQAKRALWYLPANEIEAIEYVTEEVNSILDERFCKESEILGESFTRFIMLKGGKIAGLELLSKLGIREVRHCRGIDITTELYDIFIDKGANSDEFKRKLNNEARRVQRYIYSCYPRSEDYNFLLRCSDTSADFLHKDLWGSFPTFGLEKHNYGKENYKKFGVKNIELNIIKMLKDFEELKQEECIEAPRNTKLAINIVRKIEQDYKGGTSRISAKYENGHLKMQISTPLYTSFRRGEISPNQFIDIDQDGNISVWQSEKIYNPGTLLKEISSIKIQLLDKLLKESGLPTYKKISTILESGNSTQVHNIMNQLLAKKDHLLEQEREILKQEDVDDIDLMSDNIKKDGLYYLGEKVGPLFGYGPMHDFLHGIEWFISSKHNFEYKNPHTIGNKRSKISMDTIIKVKEMMAYIEEKLEKGIEMEFMCIADDSFDQLYPVQLKPIQDRNFPFVEYGNEHKSDHQILLGKTPFVFGNFEITCRIISCYKNDHAFLRTWEKVAIEGQSGARFFYNDFKDFGLTVATDHGIILAHDIDYIPIHKKGRREYRSIGIPNSDLNIDWEDAKSTVNGRTVGYKISKDYYTFKSDGKNGEVFMNKKR